MGKGNAVGEGGYCRGGRGGCCRGGRLLLSLLIYAEKCDGCERNFSIMKEFDGSFRNSCGRNIVLEIHSRTPAFGGISLVPQGYGAFGAAFRVPAAPILRRLRRR